MLHASAKHMLGTHAFKVKHVKPVASHHWHPVASGGIPPLIAWYGVVGKNSRKEQGKKAVLPWHHYSFVLTPKSCRIITSNASKMSLPCDFKHHTSFILNSSGIVLCFCQFSPYCISSNPSHTKWLRVWTISYIGRILWHGHPPPHYLWKETICFDGRQMRQPHHKASPAHLSPSPSSILCPLMQGHFSH